MAVFLLATQNCPFWPEFVRKFVSEVITFDWARRNDVLETIPNIDAISKGKTVRKEMYTFNSKQIKKLLSAADVKMKAMIWLGLNCGFGCTDCGRLKWKDLDLKNGRVGFPRNKTGVERNLPLWAQEIG